MQNKIYFISGACIAILTYMIFIRNSETICDPTNGSSFWRGCASLMFFGFGFLLKSCYSWIWIIICGTAILPSIFLLIVICSYANININMIMFANWWGILMGKCFYINILIAILFWCGVI